MAARFTAYPNAQGVKPGGLNGAVGAAVNQPTYKQARVRQFRTRYKTLFPSPRAPSISPVSAYFTKATDVSADNKRLAPVGRTHIDR